MGAFLDTSDHNIPSLKNPPTTPIKLGSSSTLTFSTHTRRRVEDQQALGKEMSSFFLGPMPAEEFLDVFFPHHLIEDNDALEFTPGQFDDIVEISHEPSLYDPLVKVLQMYLTNSTCVNTSARIDVSSAKTFNWGISPDILSYREGKHVVKSSVSDISLSDLVIEVKTRADQDPFIDSKSSSSGCHVKDTNTAYEVMGQLTSYAAAQFGSQFRTCAYQVLIIRDRIRLLRWDRSGTIFTDLIPWNVHATFVKFLCRFNNATSQTRGIDPSVTQPTVPESARAREALNLGAEARLCKLQVRTADESDQYEHHIVGAPVPLPFIPPGRGTRGFIAYDDDTGSLRWLKDSWRVDMPGINPEGLTYQRLHAAGVNYIPVCLASGDIYSNVTVTQDYLKHPLSSWVSENTSSAGFVKHRHYRLVLDTVGRNIFRFPSTFSLTTAFMHIIMAHEQALSRAQILHRDISAGNILINDNGEGVLIDWDLSKDLSDANLPIRQIMRTGTWQFMSARLVESRDAPHTYADDLESVFWVYLWVNLLFKAHNKTKAQVAGILNSTFDPKPFDGSGGNAKGSFLVSQLDIESIDFENCPKIGPLIRRMASFFSWRYKKPNKLQLDLARVLNAKPDDVHSSNRATPSSPLEKPLSEEVLKYLMAAVDSTDIPEEVTHKALFEIINVALSDRSQWPEADEAQRIDLDGAEEGNADPPQKRRKGTNSRTSIFLNSARNPARKSPSA